jgi:hypothetical protein
VQSEDGDAAVCSRSIHPEPFDLRSAIGSDSLPLLQSCSTVTRYYRSRCSVTDWFGVYQKRKSTDARSHLLKLSYFGAPSRALFPLTPEFAAHSNNSSVGITGRARIISSVEQHVAAGGQCVFARSFNAAAVFLLAASTRLLCFCALTLPHVL